MKKIAVLFLASACVLTLAGCAHDYYGGGDWGRRGHHRDRDRDHDRGDRHDRHRGDRGDRDRGDRDNDRGGRHDRDRD